MHMAGTVTAVPASRNLKKTIMKKSDYNIIIPTKGVQVLYNTFSDRFIGLSRPVAECLASSSPEEFAGRYPAQFERLKEAGVFIPDDFSELESIRGRYRSAVSGGKDMYVMIFPTQDCNLKCWYCYESHVKGSRMDRDVMRRSVKSIKGLIDSRKPESLLLGFFGGEPLIDFHDIAYPLSMEIKRYAEERGVRFATFIVTNASLIDGNVLSILPDINPMLQITLDGNRGKHDSVRIWKKDGSGSYDTIIDAITRLSRTLRNDFSEDPTLTVRINYDNQTLRYADDIIRDLANADKNNIVVHFERVWQTQHLVDERQRELLLETLRKFISNGFTVRHGVFRKKKVSCPSDTRDFMIINYDGNLYKCNGRTLTPESREGHLSEDGEIVWDEGMLAKRYSHVTFENPKCLVCKMLPLCMGPCTQKYMETGRYCDTICSKTSIDFTVDDYILTEFEIRYILQHTGSKEVDGHAM